METIEKEKRHREKNELLFKESQHRATNNIQSILNFLLFQKEDIEDKKTKELLINLENRIIATTEVSSLLYNKEENTSTTPTK